MTSHELIDLLPPLQGRRDTINSNQQVPDIMREVLDAHKIFAPDYQLIGKYFDGGTDRQIAERLFKFCKRNIRYVVETVSLQSTRSPRVILSMGSGDCKHYASFIGGCMAAIGGIDCVYRFASYDFFSTVPGHVFIVVNPGPGEIWVDPVLTDFDQRNPSPVYKKDKKIMALQRIYGTGAAVINGPRRVYAAHTTVRRTDLHILGTTKVFPKGGTLSEVAGWGFASGWNYFTKIYGTSLPVSNLPCVFTVDGEPFDLPPYAYMARQQGKPIPVAPQGLQVVYPSSYNGIAVRSDMLRPIITPSGTMLIQAGDGTMYDLKGLGNGGSNAVMIANSNHLLNMLISATGAIQMAYQPYPDAENLQRFYDSMLRLRDMNFMLPREIKTVAGSFFQAIAHTIAGIGKGFVKFIGIIPRTAFLQLVRLNVKGMATHLYANLLISSQAVEIKKKWEGFGGEYNSLLNAARDGSVKKALLGIDTIGEPVTAAALIASAAPLIALLAAFLKSAGNPQLNGIVDTAIAGMNRLLIASGEDPIAVSESMGGKDVIIQNPGGGTITIPPTNAASGGGIMAWIENNPLPAVGIGAGIVLVGMGTAKKYRR